MQTGLGEWKWCTDEPFCVEIDGNGQWGRMQQVESPEITMVLSPVSSKHEVLKLKAGRGAGM
jgi:hypothetical protein